MFKKSIKIKEIFLLVWGTGGTSTGSVTNVGQYDQSYACRDDKPACHRET